LRIREDDPSAALRTVTTIYDSAAALNTFPNRGRKGRVEGTRELPLPPLPFIIVYRVLATLA
jgi:plasmid stabilization system protein ParE